MKTGPLTVRLTVLLLILVGVHAAYAFFRSSTPHKVRAPKCDLDELPMQLGDWKWRDQRENNAQFDDLAGADESTSRVYTNPKEQAVVSAYIAFWTDYEGQLLPHEPTECYPAAGFEIQEINEIRLKDGQEPSAYVRLMRCERNGQSTYVLYWYQLDQETMYTISGMRDLRWKYLGERRWPPLVKVMLEIRNRTPQRALEILRQVGEQIYAWVDSEL